MCALLFDAPYPTPLNPTDALHWVYGADGTVEGLLSHLKMNDGKAMYINDEFANFLTQLGLNKGKGGGVHDVALFLKVCKIIAEFVSTSSPLNPG